MSFIEKYLKEPFRYATSDWIKILIGSLLSFFSALVTLLSTSLLAPSAIIFMLIIFFMLISLVIDIILLGYYIGVAKNTLKGVDTLPNWSNFIEFIKDGILYYIAMIIVLLMIYLPAILLTVGIFSAVGGGFGNHLAFNNSISMYLLVVIGIVLYIIVASIAFILYFPLATVNFAKKGFSGFFEFFNILKKISLEYILILILYFILNVITYFILTIILIIPIVGILIYITCGMILTFLLGVAAIRAISKYYLEKEI
ncbi:MAG TPA: DUF4013 domain-containing protein [Methanothermococcus okinawensis]|uniref:DUF4013 domain-containing protein n=1 Tax=Methanothermococcus okinawensis TaxID=155863 RepID=A0A833DRM4_9EURY|nr:DUF4013 domain-containing protein [Methanothermococcus okinawensis]